MQIFIVKSVEDVEKFILSSFFSGNKLDIVDQEHVAAAVDFSKGGGSVGADRVDQVIGKFFRGNIQHLQATLVGGVANGMQQVGFPNPTPP